MVPGRSLALTCAATLLLSAASVRAVADAAETAARWLGEMESAFSDLNYDGIFSYLTGSDLATLRVVHMVIDGRQRERLVHLNGAPREILRDGESVSCIVMPGDDLLKMEGSMPSGPFARGFVRRFDQVSDNYALTLAGRDRVANRTALRMLVQPKDDDRFGYRLWLDEATKLLLRSELVDATGKRLEVFQFNQLAIGPEVDVAALEPTTASEGMVSHLTLADRVDPNKSPAARARYRLQWIPRGFQMAAADVRRKPSSLTDVVTMMYSDGLAAFSVFVEDMPPNGAASMVSRNGATVAVTHLTEFQGSTAERRVRHLITVVGELPTGTAQRIAQSVEPGAGTERTADTQ
ncbi:MAG: MucB/RseB C-terminal domain-containing protein [Pseudomonadota bacterium]